MDFNVASLIAASRCFRQDDNLVARDVPAARFAGNRHAYPACLLSTLLLFLIHHRGQGLAVWIADRPVDDFILDNFGEKTGAAGGGVNQRQQLILVVQDRTDVVYRRQLAVAFVVAFLTGRLFTLVLGLAF